jgi:dihydroorotase
MERKKPVLILIKNGYVIDPAADREGYYDILIEDDLVKQIDRSIPEEEFEEMADESERVRIDAAGKYVMPGFIDLHVHLREPGFEYKETIRTGALAAAAGGFTTICPMPNTKPTIDSADRIRFLKDKAAKEAVIHVLPIGSITLGQEGKVLADIASMAEAGAVALSEDGKSVMDSALYAKAMREAAKAGIPIFAHCEDKDLAANGVMNAGKRAEELGLTGISNAVEDIITARDILLAKKTGVRLHICHCSTVDSASFIGLAKEKGLPVTGEVCPHHFALSDEDIPADEANYKMNPPLRSPKDVQAVKEALRNDIIDVIATDHAPHGEEEKSGSMVNAPFGIVGLETAFSLTMTELVKPGVITLRQMVEKMSANPANILGIRRGCIEKGWVADLVIADPKKEYRIDKSKFYSKGRNTPFNQKKVVGRIEYTLAAGKIVYKAKV